MADNKLITTCDWTNKVINDTEESIRSYKKLIDVINNRAKVLIQRRAIDYINDMIDSEEENVRIFKNIKRDLEDLGCP